MHDPFAIDSRTAISVSGGRTSGYMLWRFLQANGGQLPACAVPIFANTGKEEEATLRFVRDMGVFWNVPITWVEYRDDDTGFAVVDFETAARNGEPFAQVIKKRVYLPNPVARFCTMDLKIRPMHKFIAATYGWADVDGWDEAVGIRADEHRRVAKIRANNSAGNLACVTRFLPLAEAGVTVADVGAFWSAQPFQLGLSSDSRGRTVAGNCDLCYLKPHAQIMSLIRERPERAVWWIQQEAFAKTLQNDPNSSGIRFRFDRPSYAQMAAFVEAQADMFDPDEEAIPCFCGD